MRTNSPGLPPLPYLCLLNELKHVIFETLIFLDSGVYKVPYHLVFLPPPPPFFQILFFSNEISVPIPFFPLDILANSLNIKWKLIAYPLSFLHVIFFPTALMFPSSQLDILLDPTNLINDKELYTSLVRLENLWNIFGKSEPIQGTSSCSAPTATRSSPPQWDSCTI